jgi:hypothetical protein
MDRETEKEIQKMREVVPLTIEAPIMYWRPQKVGTSTIFSLLLSYSFRYNQLLRRKGPRNSFCKRIIQCGDHYLTRHGQQTASSNTTSSEKAKSPSLRSNNGAEWYSEVIEKKLTHYRKPFTVREKNQETLSEQNWFTIVGTHNLCNMPAKYVSAGLRCAFQNNLTFVNNKPFGDVVPLRQTTLIDKVSKLVVQREAHHSPSYSQRQKAEADNMASIANAYFSSSPFLIQLLEVPPVREIFSVRDPVSRMISCYYFWGELMKMKMTGGSSIGSTSNRVKTVGRNATSAGQSWGAKLAKLLSGNNGSNQDKTRKLSSEEGLDMVSEPADESRRRLVYHGDETTVPPLKIAMEFAKRLPIAPGMLSGPGSTWSLFSDAVGESVEILGTDRVGKHALARTDMF